MANSAIGTLVSKKAKNGKEYFLGKVCGKPVKAFWDKKNDKLLWLFPKDEKDNSKADPNNAKENSNVESEKENDKPEGEDKQQ